MLKQTTAQLILFLLLSTTGLLRAQNYSTGLIFSSAAEYAKIPEASMPLGAGNVPTVVDFSVNMPPVGDQNPQNSCVAWAIAYGCKSYQEKMKGGYTYTTSGSLDYSKVFSPAFLYNLINNGQNVGTSFVDACEIAKEYGLCTWQAMPYQPNNWVTRPNANQLEAAKKFKIETYRRLDLTDATTSIKAQLLGGLPVIISTVIDKNYYNGGFNTTQNPYIWKSVGSISAGMGHAILIVGYDDNKNAFKFMNSWGQNWGNNGYGWISYNVVKSVVREAYIIKSSQMPNTDVTNNPLTQNNNTLDNNDINNYGLSFNIYNVFHENNFTAPGVPVLNRKMIVQGNVSIPKNLGSRIQIVINFYFNNAGYKGIPVGSINPNYALLNGTAATGTSVLTLPQGTNYANTWEAYMPYSVLNISRGQFNPWGVYVPATSYLFAEPVLFMDGFPVRIGGLIPFSVSI
jgi:C1A family cysteine protease